MDPQTAALFIEMWKKSDPCLHLEETLLPDLTLVEEMSLARYQRRCFVYELMPWESDAKKRFKALKGHVTAHYQVITNPCPRP